MSASPTVMNTASNTRLTEGGHHVLEEEAFHRHETLSFVLSVRTLVGLQGQQNAHAPLCRSTLLVKSTPYFFQSCRKAHWVLDDVSATSAAISGGSQVATEFSKGWPVAAMRRTAVFLSVRFLAGFHGQHDADLFLCRKRATKISKG